jgi:hypothetical protein
MAEVEIAPTLGSELKVRLVLGGALTLALR